jgi:hypothetical protein
VTGPSYSPPPYAATLPEAVERRPATVLAAFVTVLAHVALLVVGVVVSVVGLTGFLLTHPSLADDPTWLLPSVVLNLGALLVATAEVVLALRFWRGVRSARVVQTVLSGAAAAMGLAGTAITVSRSTLTNPLPVVSIAVCLAVIVLLWLPASSAWFGRRSVGPARPGL